MTNQAVPHTTIPAGQLTPLDQLALALLCATTVDALVAAAQEALPRVLGDELRWRVLVAQSSGDTTTLAWTTDDRACIPLRAGGAVVGAVVGRGDGTPPRLADDALVWRVAALLAAAVVGRQRAAAEQARLLEGAADLKLDIVSMLSHEMRTPLASIKGYASALLLPDTSWDDTTRTEFVQAIDEEADYLTRLVSDVLDSATIEAGALRMEREPILIPKIARRVVEKLGGRTTRHRFVLSFAEDFPIVEADAQRIDQVLTNLVDNAVKYSPDGGLIVVRGETLPGEVVVSVIDQGIGIAPEHLNKLFERFFRATPNGRGRVVGTGLGLPISDAIVRGHGGRIWAESVPGSGTTLSFTLPLTSALLGREPEQEADA